MIGTVSEEIHQVVVFPFALFFLEGHVQFQLDANTADHVNIQQGHTKLALRF